MKTSKQSITKTFLNSSVTPMAHISKHAFMPLKKPLMIAMGISILTAGLVGCGGGGNSGNSGSHDDSSTNVSGNNGDANSDNNGDAHSGNNGGTPASTASFSETATWTVDGTKTGDTCYDFDSKTEIECSGDKWDVKFSNQNRSVTLWTNSGVSGAGKAASYVAPWSELSSIKNDQDIIKYNFAADKASNIFTQNPWSAYDVNGQHKLSPNNRVYLITTDAADASTTSTVNKPVYAMQIINYYNDAAVSGHPTIRWIDTALPTQVQTKTIDATSYTDWVYVNLKTGDITDKAGDWQVGFRRYDVILNNGISGDGKVGGYVAKTPADYYDADGKPIKAKFLQDNIQASQADLTQVSDYTISSDGVPWVVDAASSPLNPKSTGNYPTIDYGWYVYKANEGHRLFAKSMQEAIGGMIRSAEGNSYARMYLEDIKYDNPNIPAPTQWTYKFEIQPATK